MKKNLTELVFILDRSGSMPGLEGDTIGGFNAMIEKQKREPGEALRLHGALLTNESEVHPRPGATSSEVRPMTEREYYRPGLHRPAGRHRRGHPPHREHPQVRPA